jgi:trypsin-like peptidase
MCPPLNTCLQNSGAATMFTLSTLLPVSARRGLAGPSLCVHGTLILLLSGGLLGSASTQSMNGPPATDSANDKDLYNSAAQAVFRVEAGLAHGSGFLVDSSGLVLTNDHVIGTSADVTVYVEPTARFSAEVVLRDADADVAVLRLPRAVINGRRTLRLVDTPVQVGPGDRIIALGYPLNQPLTMTSGMVANVRPSAILIDALVNPGNSGGPILGPDGAVVAITTFIDPANPGPGLGGGVLVDRAHELLELARKSPAQAPEGKPRKAFPLETYRLSALKAIADTIDPLLFTSGSSMTDGPFSISVSTPLAQMLSAITTGRQVSKDRRKREERANIPESQRYSDVGAMYDWRAYVGEVGAPVVAVEVEPLVGETGASSFRRGVLSALVGVGGQATVRFQGDVRNVVLRRDGVPVEPLRGGHTPMRIGLENDLLDFKDVADYGYYLYSPDVFAPDAPQRPPEITLEIEDLKHPSTKRVEKLSPLMVARVWNDFEAFFSQGPREKAFARYALTKSCTLDGGAGAMGGTRGVSPSTPGANCTYALAAPGKQ